MPEWEVLGGPTVRVPRVQRAALEELGAPVISEEVLSGARVAIIREALEMPVLEEPGSRGARRAAGEERIRYLRLLRVVADLAGPGASLSRPL